MTQEVKQQIAGCLRAYVGKHPSQNKAANSLKNVSSATISQVLNNKWELIGDEMWRNIAAQTGYNARQWAFTETSTSRKLYWHFDDAKSDGGVHAVTGNAGCGKTAAAARYCGERENAYHVVCAEYWNRKTFLMELLEAMGIDPSGYPVGEMMRRAVKALKAKDAPLVILDEADKLGDQVLYFFITLYNQLEDDCGLVLLATDFLEKRVTRGVSLKKKGYNEIFSRVGRRFIGLPGNTSEDIAAVCAANGVTDAEAVRKIIDGSEADLRRVKKLAKANIKKAAKAA